MTRKTKPLTEKGSLGFNDVPLKSRPSIEEYRRALDSFMLQKELSVYAGRFVWEGLPKGLNGNLIETMLYYKGQLAFFKSGSKYYILPFVYTGTMNHYGLPEKILPIPFNGKIEDEKNPKGFIADPKIAVVYPDEEVYDEYEVAVVLRERSSLMIGFALPSIVLTDQLRKKLSEHLILVRNNIILSQPMKYVSVETQDKANSVATQFDSLINDVLQGNVIQTIVGHTKLNDVMSEAPKIDAQKLWQSYSSLDALRLEGLGILNTGTFEKHERILQGEIAGKQSESKLVLQDHLAHRETFCKMLKQYFNLDVTVKLNKAVLEDDTDYDDGRVGSTTGGIIDEE